ncbi:MAG: threonine/serine exporter family protein [Phycisphaerales bacterium]
MTESTIQPADRQRVEEFILELARTLHRYGTPAHQLEAALSTISARLGVEAHFFSVPTSITSGFGPLPEQRVRIMRVDPGEIAVEKLVLVDEVAERVASGAMPPGEGTARLREIEAKPDRFSPMIQVGAGAILTASAARMFGGGWREIVAAGAAGLATGLLALVASRHRNAKRLIEAIAGFTCALVAVLMPVALDPFNGFTVLLSGLIVFFPGLTLTMAMTELATRNFVSGTARLTGAFMVLLSLGFGSAVGLRAQQWLALSDFNTAPIPLPWWTELLAVGVAPFAFMIAFRARPRDFFPFFIAGWIAYYGSRQGVRLLGPEVGVWVAALLVGLFANGYARVTNRPSAVAMLPGIILLVPGSVGFRSFDALLKHDVLAGINSAFGMILVAVSLVAGLLIANVALPPRKVL